MSLCSASKPDIWFVCNIPLLVRALGLNGKATRDDRVSCIQSPGYIDASKQVLYAGF